MSRVGQENIGSYRLLSLLGVGRTCQVWDAMHDARQQRVAIKIVMPQFSKHAETVTLLKHDYAVGRQLDHPNAIKMYESGVFQGQFYLVMELFPAPNLKQLILQGVEPLAYLAPTIIRQAAEALGDLHRLGWVHRDVKPDNFLVNRQGDLRLIDFALAERRKGLFGRLLSGRGKIQGTRSYMSPEQIRGQAIDERADIYSLGCLIFELLSGKLPFTGSNTQELLMKHLKAPPPSLEAANRNVTSAFSQLVKQMLAKRPKDRPQSMDEIAREATPHKMFRVIPRPPEEADTAELRE